jgi:hypothetical protein
VRDVSYVEQAMSVGLDGCESVPSLWLAMAAEWYTCPRSAGTGGQGVPVGDMAGMEQANFEASTVEEIFENFVRRILSDSLVDKGSKKQGGGRTLCLVAERTWSEP